MPKLLALKTLHVGAVGVGMLRRTTRVARESRVTHQIFLLKRNLTRILHNLKKSLQDEKRVEVIICEKSKKKEKKKKEEKRRKKKKKKKVKKTTKTNKPFLLLLDATALWLAGSFLNLRREWCSAVCIFVGGRVHPLDAGGLAFAGFAHALGRLCGWRQCGGLPKAERRETDKGAPAAHWGVDGGG